MVTFKCCVGGCDATSATHRLFNVPKDDERRSLWMSFLVPTNPLLIGLSKEQLLRKRVCHKHFETRQLDGLGRRTRYSYPNLFTAKEMEHGTPLCSEEYNVLAEHNYHKQPEEDASVDYGELLLVIEKADDHHLLDHAYVSSSSDQARPDNIMLTGNITAPITVNTDFVTPASNSKEQEKKGKRRLIVPSCSSQDTYLTSPTPRKKTKASLPKKVSSKKRKIMREAESIATESLGMSAMERLNEAKKLSQNDDFLSCFNELGKHAKTLLTMQLKLVRKNRMARRFTMEEKLLALTLMKQSPKGYKLWEKMFALPTKRTLNRMSQKISFEPGINPKVFKYVQEMTKNWTTQKKLCTIIFDEVALTPHLTYDEGKDIINGFVEIDKERKFKYCDHALVFMIRGVCSPWRQTLAYYFCEGTVSAVELSHILKEIVSQIDRIGLKPLGLVCDQGSTFRTALNRLRHDTIRTREASGIRDDGTVELAGLKLSIFYDPPHLLKSIRNNFVTKDMLFNSKPGSWKDIMFIYDIDNQLGHTRALPKLTAHHVIPNKIKKMKVSSATQVLSAKMAAMLKFTNALNVRNSINEDNDTMATTAEIVEFFDNLFDSVNGSPGAAQRGKLRRAAKKSSPHIEFWKEAIKKLKNIKFIDKTSKLATQAGNPRIIRVPCLEGWITTLESFIRVSKLLFDKYEVDYYYPRCVNQDPLENFFGRIRALNYRNVNPDAYTFISAFKALALSSILNPHSRFSNCEEDNGETLLDLNFLFAQESADKENAKTCPSNQTQVSSSSSSQRNEKDARKEIIMEKVRVQCSAYTAGYICRKITKFIKCYKCTKTFTTRDVSAVHLFIQHREFKSLKGANLTYPNESFLRLYREAAQYIHTFLNIHAHERNLGKKLKIQLIKYLRVSWLGCSVHAQSVVSRFIKFVIKLQVHNWCKIINKILKGDIEKKYAEKMQEPQRIAYRKYEKIRLRKKALSK